VQAVAVGGGGATGPALRSSVLERALVCRLPCPHSWESCSARSLGPTGRVGLL
jgi:hypothetical protein